MLFCIFISYSKFKKVFHFINCFIWLSLSLSLSISSLFMADNWLSTVIDLLLNKNERINTQIYEQVGEPKLTDERRNEWSK